MWAISIALHQFYIHILKIQRKQTAKYINLYLSIHMLKQTIIHKLIQKMEEQEIKQKNSSQSGKKCSKSHIVLIVSASILTLFTLTMISIVAKSILAFHNFTTYNWLAWIFVGVGSALLIASIIAIVSSFQKFLKILHAYEVALCILFVFLLVIALSISQMQSSHSQTCESSNGYFEFQMFEAAASAEELLCSESCPCPQNKIVQNCKGCTPSLGSQMLTVLQQRFSCSGWCQQPKLADKNYSYYLFNDKSSQPKSSCWNAWTEWLNSQIQLLLSFLITNLCLIVVVILTANLRIIAILSNQ